MASPEKLSVHQKIMRAWRRGTGIRLTPDDVEKLAFDDAISTAASNDDEAMDLPQQKRPK